MPNCIASVHRTTAFSTVCHCTTVCHHCMSSLHVTPPVASLHLTTAVHHCNVSQHLTTAVHHCIITLFYHCELHRITLHSCISTLNTPHFHCIGLLHSRAASDRPFISAQACRTLSLNTAAESHCIAQRCIIHLSQGR